MSLREQLQRHLPVLSRPLVPFLAKSAPSALTTMVHQGGGGSLVSMMLPNTRYDFEKEAGAPMKSSVIAAPLNFLLSTFPEAPPIIERQTDSGDQWELDPKHDLQKLLRRPNPFYSGRVLGQCTALDLAFGYAYWLKIRNDRKEVIQLWWAPRHTLEPKWGDSGKSYIDWYDYKPGGSASGGQPIKVRPEDVVHFRFGLDPENPRQGLSKLGALFREIGIDNEASNFTAAILKNLGIIGVILSPDGDSVTVPAGALDEIKAYLKAAFSGDKRGEPLALSRKTKVDLLQYQMQGFDVSPLRDVSEERVCAAMGIPAAVVGFGTGLHQTKVGATMKEMRQLAWTGGIIPIQDSIADQVDFSLLPDFSPKEAEDSRIRMRYDTSKVRALWEDAKEKHERVRGDYQAGLIDRAEARRETGRATRPEDAGFYYKPSAANGAQPTEPPKPAEPPKPDDAEDNDEDEET